MTTLSDLLWDSSLDDLKKGYIHKGNIFTCLACGKICEEGLIYSINDSLFDAKRYIQEHIRQEHTSAFSCLINMDKKYTGLTNHQKELLTLFEQDIEDDIVSKQLNIQSKSTVRNHRFAFREKAKQAKIYLAIIELMEEHTSKNQKLIQPHKTATNLDERYVMTRDEYDDIIQKYFKNDILLEFPSKQKRKIAILKHIAQNFESGKIYSEQEINAILKKIFDDYVTIRRYLIEYGFLDREPGGLSYWVKL